MTFAIKAYKAKGLGHVSVMRAKGFFGLMKMDTLIINPSDVDLPLYSYDRIFAMGNDTLDILKLIFPERVRLLLTFKQSGKRHRIM